MKFELPDFEFPTFISGRTAALIVIGLVMISFFSCRGYFNSRRSLKIMEIQVPNITRIAFETQVFALTPANLEPTLARVTEQFSKGESEKFREEFDSHLWIAVMIRNKGLKPATEVLTRVQLTTPITALHGLTSTSYGKLEVKEGGKGKEMALVNWNYIEPAIMAVTLIGVQPEDFGGKPPYSKKDLQTWARDFRLFFEFAEIKSKEGAIDYAY